MAGLFFQQLLASFGENIIVIISNIPRLLYFLYACLAQVIDFFQFLFRSLAGLQTVYINGAEYEGDIVSKFFIDIVFGEYPILQTAFWSLVVLGVLLLIISTIIANISNELKPNERGNQGEKKLGNSKSGLVGNALKGLMYIAIIPVTCIFGIMLLNAVLKGVDSATTTSETSSSLTGSTYTDENNISHDSFKKNSYGKYCYYELFGIENPDAGYSPFSGLIFKISAYSANRVRSVENFYNDVIMPDEASTATASANFGVFNQAGSQEAAAQIIDEAFANNAILQNAFAGKTLDGEKGDMSKIVDSSRDVFGSAYNKGITRFSKFNVGLVWYYYDLWQFNYIVAFAVIIILAKIFINITFGLVNRIIMLLGLFIISPVCSGLMPIKSEAFKAWKDSFLKNAVSVVGAVAGMNIALMLISAFGSIHFFPVSWSFLNLLVSTLFMLAAISLVDKFIKLVAGMVGGENLSETGAETYAGTTSALNTGIKGASSVGKFLQIPLAAKGVASLAKKAYSKRTDRFENQRKSEDKLYDKGIKESYNTRDLAHSANENRFNTDYAAEENTGRSRLAELEQTNNNEASNINSQYDTSLQNTVNTGVDNKIKKNLASAGKSTSSEDIAAERERLGTEGVKKMEDNYRKTAYYKGKERQAKEERTSQLSAQAAKFNAEISKVEKSNKDKLDSLVKNRDFLAQKIDREQEIKARKLSNQHDETIKAIDKKQEAQINRRKFIAKGANVIGSATVNATSPIFTLYGNTFKPNEKK